MPTGIQRERRRIGDCWNREAGLASLLCLLAAMAMPGVARAQDTSNPLSQIDAFRVAVISDGDFLASTYADGRLAAQGRFSDVLTVFTLRDGQVSRSEIPASNSVTAAPEVLAASPDGTTFFVVDRLARSEPDDRQTRDLAPGRTLTIVRVDPDDGLSETARVTVPPSSEALAVHPSGTLLAIVGNDEHQSTLTLIPLADGKPRRPIIFTGAQLGLNGAGEGPRGGMMLTNVQWRPDGGALAINDTGLGRIAFYNFTEGPSPTLTPWGSPLGGASDPFVGRFAPDGRHYLTSDWGRDLSATTLDARIPQVPGRLGVIRLEADGEHQRVGSTETGLSPEGLAVSPDGRLVATVNMRGTAFPPGSPRYTPQASVALLSLDPATGAAVKLGEFFFDGVLPEGATFDVTGRHLLVTVFEGRRDAPEQAGVEVFRIDGSGRMTTPTRLHRLGRFRTPHGAHHVVATSAGPQVFAADHRTGSTSADR